jgi:hypothetical protein
VSDDFSSNPDCLRNSNANAKPISNTIYRDALYQGDSPASRQQLYCVTAQSLLHRIRVHAEKTGSVALSNRLSQATQSYSMISGMKVLHSSGAIEIPSEQRWQRQSCPKLLIPPETSVGRLEES